MTPELFTLLLAAASLAVTHILFGPDHYIPFIALNKSQDWSIKKTLWLTTLCGFGHVLSSILICAIGLWCFSKLNQITWIEALRGHIAGWGLIAMGFTYLVWALHQKTNSQAHAHKDMMPWVLFILFVLGPCEPLIPFLLYPATNLPSYALPLVALVFGVTTILTMVSAVWLGVKGMAKISLPGLHPYRHVLTGSLILGLGLGVQFLGL